MPDIRYVCLSPAEQGPFYQRLSSLIQANDGVWSSLSAAAAELVTERSKALAAIIASADQPHRSEAAPALIASRG